MRNALFINGFNSDEHSSTGAKVKNVLKELGFSTMIKTFDVLSPFKTKKEIDEMLKSGSFNLVVGHSLGGFYTLATQFPKSLNAKKIIINPSIVPEEDLKRIASLREEILEEFAILNKEIRKISSKEEKDTVFALFGKRDELIADNERKPYIDLFLKHYGNNYEILECTHRPDEESLKIGLRLALETLGIAK